MNLLTLAQRLYRESGRSGGGPTAFAGATGPSLSIFEAIQDAWRNIQTEPNRNWRFLRKQTLATLGINTIAYTPAALSAPDWARWKAEDVDYFPTVYDPANAQTEWKLRWADYDTFASQFQRGTHTAGPPQFWSIAPDGSFLVGPKPDIAYTLRTDYFMVPQELTADAVIPIAPDRFHMLIVWNALEMVAVSDNAPEKVVKAQTMAEPLENGLRRDQAEQLRITARPLGYFG